MASIGSVTQWLEEYKSGDRAAVQKLWENYFRRLVGLARGKLAGLPRGAADEEDVALSAFDSFCRGVEGGRFPRLDDRDDLWRLLVTLTERKAIGLRRHQQRHKRGGGQVVEETALAAGDATSPQAQGLDQVAGPGPTPEFAAMVAEECQRLLAQLGSAELRTVALGKMEGYTTEELAARLDLAPRTIERKLRLIRTLWQQEEVP